jgi:uncharacterized protein (TIGR03435 family)
MIRAALVLAIVVLESVPSGTQSPAAPPSFSAASIRPSASRSTGASYAGLEDGSVMISNMSVMAMVAEAYGIDESIARFILAGDDPLLSDRFNVNAKGPASATRDQQRLMLRTLLADRFGLRTHTEKRDVPVYAVTVVKEGSLGPKLRPSTTNCRAYMALARAVNADVLPIVPRNADGAALCPSIFVSASPSVTLRGAGTLLDLVTQLQPWVDRPVVDSTALAGNFEWSVTLSHDRPAQASMASLMTAFEEQLGLAVDATSAPMDVRVIDAVELPRLN